MKVHGSINVITPERDSIHVLLSLLPRMKGKINPVFSFCLQFYINFNMEQFYLTLPDGSMLNFPNRLGDVKYKFFDVSGDARIIGIKMK